MMKTVLNRIRPKSETRLFGEFDMRVLLSGSEQIFHDPGGQVITRLLAGKKKTSGI
jgi:hypothetical protein